MHQDLLIFDRVAREDAEDQLLAPWASKSRSTRGRRLPEPQDLLRTDFQRDRDRIVHCTAFRRLIGKTQVFVSDTGDHFRVRLTHSLEVAQIGRSLARALRMNEDLTEALALSHDLGHAPFGHVGGDVLDELMEGFGGFEHNHQSLRILDRIETRDPGIQGLNLTYEVRESILKHKRPFTGKEYEAYCPEEGPCLEAQIVDFADGIAYNSHDVDDALRAGILQPEDLRDLEIWQAATIAAKAAHPDSAGRPLVHRAVGHMINMQVNDLVRSTAERLQHERIRSLADVRAHPRALVGFSEGFAKQEKALRRFLYDRFYTHYKVHRMRHRAWVILTGLFGAFRKNAGLLPPRYQQIAREDGLERSISDYVSGMTDRYAQKEYALLFQPGEGSLSP